MSLPNIQLRAGRKQTAAVKISRGLIVATLASAALISASPFPAFSQVVELVIVDVKAVARGFRASKLKGTNVLNDKNEKIGEIDDIIIARDRAVFAVLQVGGFIGVGGHLIAVPFQSLTLDDSGRKITLPGASRDALKRLPEYKHSS
jgi:sporulation protein YlmC with PRC-barrel domain